MGVVEYIGEACTEEIHLTIALATIRNSSSDYPNTVNFCIHAHTQMVREGAVCRLVSCTGPNLYSGT